LLIHGMRLVLLDRQLARKLKSRQESARAAE
jgi:uncharacterized membrane protein